MSAFAFTKPNQMVAARPMFLMSASEARGGESAISFPFVSGAAAQEGEVAVLVLSDAGEHWVSTGADPTAAAEAGVPLQGPGTFQVTVRPGHKVAVHQV